MPRKKKISLGWRQAGTFPPLPYTEEDFKEFANVLEIDSLDKEAMQKLTSAAQNYFINMGRTNGIPRIGAITNSLETIRDDTKNTRNILKKIDSEAEKNMIVALNNRRFIAPYCGNHYKHMSSLSIEQISVVIERCVADLQTINQAARRALMKITDKPVAQLGRPETRRPLRLLIHDLKDIFESTTKQKARQPSNWPQGLYGPFFDFCYAVIQKIDDSIHTSTLKPQIETVLKTFPNQP
jgi:hypothetical protein